MSLQHSRLLDRRAYHQWYYRTYRKGEVVPMPRPRWGGRTVMSFDQYVEASGERARRAGKTWLRPMARRMGLPHETVRNALKRGIKRYERTWRECAP